MNSPREHSQEAIAAAKKAGEARRDAGLCLSQQGRTIATLKARRTLLLEIRASGQATSDCLHEDLQKTFAGCSGNYLGASIRSLATEGVIQKTGHASCKRASRCGSTIAVWSATSAGAVDSKLAEIDALLAVLDQPAAAKTQQELPLEGK